jgi:hypothetical protein
MNKAKPLVFVLGPAVLLLAGAVLGIAGPSHRPGVLHHHSAATIPDPGIVVAPDVLTITPDGSFGYTVTLIGDSGPRPNTPVELHFSPEAEALIAWAEGQEHPLITGTTDQNAQVTFYIAGAGCIDWDRFAGTGPYIVQVRSEGDILNEPMVNSPDAVNSAGQLPTQLGTSICEDGRINVALSDAVFHTAPIKQGLVEPCSKLTSPFDDPVGIGDAVLITTYVMSGASAACE